MKRRFRSFREGFTLLELMAVVTIVGVLASVAMPMYSRHIKRTKVTEVYLNVRKIYDGEMAYYNDDHVDSSGGTLPKQFVATRMEPPFPPVKDKRPANFSLPEWQAISFSVDGPVLFTYWADAYPFQTNYPFRPPQFDVTSDPPKDVTVAFLAAASGDIDGDGRFSRFERSAWVPVGESEFKGDVAVFAEDELE